MRYAPLVALVALLSWNGNLPAQDPVPPLPPGEPKSLSVTLASGRSFAGLVDAATDDDRLVLRFQSGGMSLTRPIRWDRIVRAAVDDQQIELPRLREVAEGMKSEARVQGAGFGSQETVDGGQRTEDIDSPPRVAASAIDPRLSNWDGDEEAHVDQVRPFAGRETHPRRTAL